MIGWTSEKCNYPPLADPFKVNRLKIYEPNRQRARQLASTYRGTLSYTASSDILVKQGLKISSKDYYNLTRKESSALLLNQEELELVIGILERNSFYPRT